MSVEKPSGEYVDEMLEPDGWVDVDEQRPGESARQMKVAARKSHSIYLQPAKPPDHADYAAKAGCE